MTTAVATDRREQELDLAALITLSYVIDADGEEAVSWYEDGMNGRTIIKNLMKDHDKRDERLALLVCTLKHI